MPKKYDWQDAIRFMTQEIELDVNPFNAIIWRRLQNGDRTQDLLMTICAMEDLKTEEIGKSPEWTEAIKWLQKTRAEQKSLKLDLLQAQLDSGDRSEELLVLIQEEMTKVEPKSKRNKD